MHNVNTQAIRKLSKTTWNSAHGDGLDCDDSNRQRHLSPPPAAEIESLSRPKRSREKTAWKVHVTSVPRSSCFTQGGMTADVQRIVAELEKAKYLVRTFAAQVTRYQWTKSFMPTAQSRAWPSTTADPSKDDTFSASGCSPASTSALPFHCSIWNLVVE